MVRLARGAIRDTDTGLQRIQQDTGGKGERGSENDTENVSFVFCTFDL